jgi:glycosyltransferase involved in cell wall biosynthesis
MFRALDVSHKIRKANPFLSWVIKLSEKLVYKNVDLLSANNSELAKYAVGISGRKLPTKTHFPPLDLKHFSSQRRDDDLRLDLGITPNQKVLVYMGSFFYFSGLAEAIREFAHLSPKAPDIKFLMIGGGELEDELHKLVNQLGISEKVVFTGTISYSDLPTYLKLADVAVNTLDPTLVANMAFPNKVLQYLASGLHVVTTRLDGLHVTLGESSSLEWADSSREVIQKSIIYLQDSTTDHSETDAKSLGKFSVNESLMVFERALEDLARQGSVA